MTNANATNATAILTDDQFVNLWNEARPSIIATVRPFSRGQKIEDMVQDACVEVWSKKDKYEVGTNFNAWAATVTRNALLTLRRREQNLRRKLDQIGSTPGNDYTPTRLLRPDEALERKQAKEQAKELIASLPENYGPVVVARELEGKDYKTISEELDIPIGTVMSRLNRARTLITDMVGA